MYSSIRGLYKIGFTRNNTGEDRKRSGTIYLPDLSIICICNFETITESELKKMFCDKRKDGEWFDLNEDDLLKIKLIMSEDYDIINKLRIQIGMLCELQYRKGLQHGADFLQRKCMSNDEIFNFRFKGYSEEFTKIQDPITKYIYQDNERIKYEIRNEKFDILYNFLFNKITL